MEIKFLKLNEILRYSKNPRVNEEAVEGVANSIKEFGFKVPIVIDKNNVIVAGDTRYLAAQELNMEEVPCIVASDLTEEQIKAYRLADNKVAEVSQWDYELLETEMQDIIGINMEDFGFEITESLDLDIDDFFEVSEETKDKEKRCPHCDGLL